MKIFLILVFLAPGMEEPIVRKGEVDNIAQCFAFARQVQESWIENKHDTPYQLTVGCRIEVTPA